MRWKQAVCSLHSVHHPLFSGGGGAGGEGGRELNLQLNFQKGGGGGLTGPQLLEVGYWEWGGDFFQARGGAHIFLKYVMTKKVYKQKIFFSVIINNSNWRFYLRI